MTIVERIRGLCRNYNITVASVERELGFANGYISKIREDTVTYERLSKIADYLRVTPQYLFTGDYEKIKILSDDEQALIAAYNRLNLHAKLKALENIEDMTQLDKYSKKQESKASIVI